MGYYSPMVLTVGHKKPIFDFSSIWPAMGYIGRVARGPWKQIFCLFPFSIKRTNLELSKTLYSKIVLYFIL